LRGTGEDIRDFLRIETKAIDFNIALEACIEDIVGAIESRQYSVAGFACKAMTRCAVELYLLHKYRLELSNELGGIDLLATLCGRDSELFQAAWAIIKSPLTRDATTVRNHAEMSIGFVRKLLSLLSFEPIRPLVGASGSYANQDFRAEARRLLEMRKMGIRFGVDLDAALGKHIGNPQKWE
jgi:hypothetical protein